MGMGSYGQPQYKYGANSYATYIGPTSEATTVLGATETNVRKQASDKPLPKWPANWKMCTEMFVPVIGTRNTQQTANATAHYGTHSATQKVITAASGYVTTGSAAPGTPAGYTGDLVYTFGQESATGVGKGYFDGFIYMRRPTK